MSGIWGRNIRLSIFGESHGPAIGITIDGLPPGLDLDIEDIAFEMRRRAPGRSKLSTTRVEEDQFEILSGYFQNKTTGTPLTAIIRNKDSRSKDYESIKDKMRPGHADYTGHIKYSGYQDYRGGGHFSGRLTAPLVFAGAIAKQILEAKGIGIGSHIKSIGEIEDSYFHPTYIREEELLRLKKDDFPVLDKEKAIEMQNLIRQAKEDKDSIGGIVECAVINLPPGLGSPFFDSLESVISSLLFAIPGLKAVEFGAGFSISRMYGSQANDQYYIDEEKKIRTYTNNNGGIIGGISSGMPLIFRAAFKPTPSIGKKQKTVDISSHENIELEIRGRHDPSIVVRAIPIVEAVAAIAILDVIQGG